MPKYMKAYLLRDMRRYAGWDEERWREWQLARPDEEWEELNDESIVFLHEGGIVTGDVFGDGDVIFDAVTPAWLEFCRAELEFEVPDWEAESARVREDLAELIRKAQEAEQSVPPTD